MPPGIWEHAAGRLRIPLVAHMMPIMTVDEMK
jgi:hypothetical protein